MTTGENSERNDPHYLVSPRMLSQLMCDSIAVLMFGYVSCEVEDYGYFDGSVVTHITLKNGNKFRMVIREE